MLDTFAQILIYIVPLMFAITLHEAAHGWMASRYGDPTAKMLGRVTANPIPHIDPVGTLLVPGVLLLGSSLTGMGGVLLGWAKPVPINTRNLSPFRQGMLAVAIAGPMANLLQAFVWLFLFKLCLVFGWHDRYIVEVSLAGVMVNFYLMAFNLLPLPPLDGGRIVTMLLPYNAAQSFARIEEYGMIVLVVLLISGFIHYWMHPFVWVAKAMIGAVL